jgi:hypothetical protein
MWIMAYKERCESVELRKFRILNSRMMLTESEKKYYLGLEKGYTGEVMFDKLTEKLTSDSFILNDLLLEVNNTSFQLDSTMIYQECIHLFEIKNYEGDYIFDPKTERFYTKIRKEIKDPLDQLKRGESLLRQFLQNHGYNFPIVPHLVFIHPNFILYQAPLDKPIIFYSQLDSFMKKLINTPSRLTTYHKKLAEKLVTMHQTESSNTKVPKYHYVSLKKGPTCGICKSFSVTSGVKRIVCNDCGHQESIESAILRNVEEIKLLFPDMKIMTNVVFEWCGGIWSKKTIRGGLKKNLILNGNTKGAFFE